MFADVGGEEINGGRLGHGRSISANFDGSNHCLSHWKMLGGVVFPGGAR